MPIVDVRPVVPVSQPLPSNAAKALANAIAAVLRAKPGTVWVRLTEISDRNYAENETTIEDTDLPVFVQIIHADSLEVGEKAREALELAAAVGNSLGRRIERVHIEYAQPARRRIAFGGQLVK